MLGHLIYIDLIARGKTQPVAKQWKVIGDEFEEVCGLKEHYHRSDVIEYLDHLRNRNLAETTIRKNLKAVKLVFDILGDSFPKLSLPLIDDSEISRPAFSKGEITQVIQMRDRLTPEEAEYFAISTTYGLRRIELAQVSSSDLNSHIPVYTAKGGHSVKQLIPDEIKPYLGHIQLTNPRLLSRLFHSICDKAEIEISNDYGWHSIRRALTTELVLAEVSALNVMRFMRWSETSVRRTFGMLPIYAVKNQEMQERVDREIFKVHPFLPFWRENVEY